LQHEVEHQQELIP
jgi:2-iminoacetate synthase ThiH